MVKISIVGDRGEYSGPLTKYAIKNVIKTVNNPICIVFDWIGEFALLEKELSEDLIVIKDRLNFSKIRIDKNYRNEIIHKVKYYDYTIILLDASHLNDLEEKEAFEDLEIFSKELQNIKKRNVYLFFHKAS